MNYIEEIIICRDIMEQSGYPVEMIEKMTSNIDHFFNRD